MKNIYIIYIYIYVYWTGRKRLVNGSYCSNFQSGKRASVKQLFTNYLGLRINSFTNLQLWRNWREKKKNVLLKRWYREIQKVNFVRKKYIIEQNLKHI